MRFSFWPNARQSWQDVLALSKHAEAMGWDGLWYADHFMPNDVNTTRPCNEVWTTLGALANAVPRVRIGPLVLGNTYRHPAVVANMAASLDHISGGRLVLGLGAGWQENEHRAYGIDYYTVGGRLKRLEEACEVIKSLFHKRSTTFSGKYYTLEDAPLEPKPLQNPLPLMIGGGGEKVTLRIVAKYADEWNVWGGVDVLKHKMSILDQHCEKLGRDPKTIQRSAAVQVFLSDDQGLVDRINTQPQARPSISGSDEQMKAVIEAYAEAGVNEIIVPDFNMTSGATSGKLEFLERFIKNVAPVVR